MDKKPKDEAEKLPPKPETSVIKKIKSKLLRREDRKPEPPDYLKADKSATAFGNRVSRRRRREVVAKRSRKINFRRARGKKWRGR
jgi:hypothetical protein